MSGSMEVAIKILYKHFKTVTICYSTIFFKLLIFSTGVVNWLIEAHQMKRDLMEVRVGAQNCQTARIIVGGAFIVGN